MLLSATLDCPKETTFFKALETMPDWRDNRGKRHSLAFILGASALAIMAGRAKVSSIQRFIRNRIRWLRTISQQPDAKPISRAHLPRLLAGVDWAGLNLLIEQLFGVHIECGDSQEWTAVDGKSLRGTTSARDKQGQRTVLAVSHSRQTILSQRPMSGPKASEITVVRALLQETGLERGQVTLDALHCNPTTTAQIHQSGGIFLTQVKENQPTLLAHCQHLATQAEPLGSQTTCNKGHGRIETRRAAFLPLEGVSLAERWAESGLQTLIVVNRKTVQVAKDKTTQETSYYITNQKLERGQEAKQADLTQAIRRHWGVESDNWIRDVTFEEDKVKTKDGNQAHTMASLRTLAMRLFRRANITDFQAAVETFADCPDELEAMLQRVGFL